MNAIKKEKINNKKERIGSFFNSFKKVLSVSLTTRRSTLAWRKIYSDEEPTSRRSKALSPVAPTKIKSTSSCSGMVLANRVLGFPISITIRMSLSPTSFARFSYSAIKF